ncbi:oligopeptidase B [Conyzicola lurida]|uniref:Oligopeptidase B n=1 Tax=Conyzicola lurida TaxID=1172621 RepID=A0A841AM96_9MICO|nr:S9 family peptidase [Conyzicola lurida]MBB5843082.1 oligopeptidase B [Conyzicola lurida]
MSLQPPIAPKVPLERVHHNDVVVDNYEWLREKENPDVVAHLEEENAYTDAQTAGLAVLREKLFEEIKGRTRETDLSVPVRNGDWWYYTRTVEGQQYGIHCRAPISDPADWTPPALETLAGEQILLDDNVEAEGLDFYSLGSFDVNGDGTLLLYAVDTEGDERYTLRIRDLATGRDLADVVEGTSAGATFDATGAFAFYTTVDDAWRPDTVWRHAVGTAASADVSVFHEPDERYWVGVGLMRSRRYLEIELGSKITSEALILSADDPTGEFSVVWPRREGVEYSIEHAVIDGADRLLIVHNDGAVDFEVVDVAADDPAGDRRALVPHERDTRIESIDAFAGHLVLEYRRDALPRIAVARLGEPRVEFAEIPFAETLFTVGAGGNPDWNQPVVRLHYGSFVTPATVNDYDVATGELRLLKQQEVLGGYDPSLFVQRREWATADDGTRVPISLVYRGDLVSADAPAPTVLYGYGSYETSIDPSFTISRLSLLDRGVVFAVAHVRGGGELGRDWYEQGKTLTKTNTFTDFVASARHLAAIGLTTPEMLVAEGGSAGGLLMGAVANLAPEAFAGILAVVPFVDPLTSILDPSLPLTVIEWDEWGNPLADAEVYRLMKSYSPYENVREVEYPRILAVTSINDTRVLYVEPAKWVARLREVGADVLLKTEMSAGHGGVSGRYEAWRKRAFELAWVLDVLGRCDQG